MIKYLTGLFSQIIKNYDCDLCIIKAHTAVITYIIKYYSAVKDGSNLHIFRYENHTNVINFLYRSFKHNTPRNNLVS